MKWFKHDTNASSDAKIRKLVLRYGTDGYAIYFHCLELISNDVSDSNLTFELEHDAEVIADNLKIKSTSDISAIDKVNNIMKYIVELGLFQDSKGRIFCLKMLKRLDSSMTSNPHMRKLIIEAKKSHDAVMIESCKIRSDKIRIDKNKIIKEEYINIAKLLYTEHLKHDDKYLINKNKDMIFNKWADDIRKLIEIDKRDIHEVANIIKWVKKDGNFWVDKIMSGFKLREKYNKLILQYKKDNKLEKKLEVFDKDKDALAGMELKYD